MPAPKHNKKRAQDNVPSNFGHVIEYSNLVTPSRIRVYFCFRFILRNIVIEEASMFFYDIEFNLD